MRALKAATIAMGVLIVASTVLLAVVIVHRLGGATPAFTRGMLDEPAGTRIMGIATAGPALAVLLQGGGPDRVLILDPRTLRPTARAALPR